MLFTIIDQLMVNEIFYFKVKKVIMTYIDAEFCLFLEFLVLKFKYKCKSILYGLGVFLVIFFFNLQTEICVCLL